MRSGVIFLGFLAVSAQAFELDIHKAISAGVLSRMGYTTTAVNLVNEGNARTDGDEWTNHAAHFDSEAFSAGSKRLRVKLDLALEHLTNCRRDEALMEIGRCFHAVQDFCSHSNLVDIGPETKIDFLNMTDPPAELFCKESSDAADYGRIKLTSGYYPNEATPEGKCSHDQLAKDGPDVGERHIVARTRAYIETAKFIDLFEQRVRDRFTAIGAAEYWIGYLRGLAVKVPDGLTGCSAAAQDLTNR